MPKATPADALIAGVRISHPDRPIYPDLGISKIDLARYYEAVGDAIVPHVADRPLTLVYCPNGLLSACLYLRHGKASTSSALRRVKIREKTKTGEYLVADDLRGVISLVQMGIVEIHTWSTTTRDLERPNRIVWDLDAGPDVRWPQIVAAVRKVRQMLESLGVQCWVKTTGGRGLHIVAPIVPQREWSECLAFSKAVAEAMVRSSPDQYTIHFAKAGRERQILIDYLRNNRSNSSVCAYSARAREGATVSTPIAWDELTSRLNPARFTVRTVPKRLAKRAADPWQGYWTSKQRLTKAMVDGANRL